MNNILTPEEFKQPVTYGDLFKIMEELGKSMQQLEECRDKEAAEILEKVSDIIADIEYKRVRDMRFLIERLTHEAYYPTNFNTYWKMYTKWCADFDALNKGDKHEG